MDSNFNAFTAIAEKTGETIMARGKKVRYAVVGLGHIAQGSVLPAFHQARQNSTLATIVSSDATKRKELSEHYDLERTWDYDQYDELLASGDIDAVFIALPNDMHRDFTVRALQAGIHVLCEKPMAITSDDCRQMIAASGDAKLMIAYRLHFEEATLQAIERVKSGEIGEPRFFHSEFSMTVKPDDIRLQRKHGGGTLYDIGVYCINAARHLFQAEPIEAMALAVADTRPRFEEVDEMTSAILRFPGDRLASFTCSFGAADYSSYRVIGTEGVLRVEPGYDYSAKITHHLLRDGKESRRAFPARDQFAGEIAYFSECVLGNRDPQPSGAEGLADIQVVEALLQSARDGAAVPLSIEPPAERPNIDQVQRKPAARAGKLVKTSSPSE